MFYNLSADAFDGITSHDNTHLAQSQSATQGEDRDRVTATENFFS